jgi:hypothetical protein
MLISTINAGDESEALKILKDEISVVRRRGSRWDPGPHFLKVGRDASWDRVMKTAMKNQTVRVFQYRKVRRL